jgi:hypothetical protein
MTTRTRSEVLADRARPILLNIALYGLTIAYGQLAAVIHLPGEPLLDNRAMGKVLGTLAKADAAAGAPYDLTAFVVNAHTGEVGRGFTSWLSPAPAKEQRLTATRLLGGRTHDHMRVVNG